MLNFYMFEILKYDMKYSIHETLIPSTFLDYLSIIGRMNGNKFLDSFIVRTLYYWTIVGIYCCISFFSHRWFSGRTKYRSTLFSIQPCYIMMRLWLFSWAQNITERAQYPKMCKNERFFFWKSVTNEKCFSNVVQKRNVWLRAVTLKKDEDD